MLSKNLRIGRPMSDWRYKCPVTQASLSHIGLNRHLFELATFLMGTYLAYPFLIVTYIAKRCELPDKCQLRAPQGTDREGLAFWTLFLVCKKVHPKCTVSILNRHLGGKKIAVLIGTYLAIRIVLQYK